MAVTWNPADKTTNVTLSNGDLTANRNGGGSTWQGVRATTSESTGKFYVEFTVDVLNGSSHSRVGVLDGSSTLQDGPGESATGWDVKNNGTKENNGVQGGGYGTAWSASDVIMMAVDLTNSKIWWGKNGTWFSSGDPAVGTNPGFTNLSGAVYPVFAGFVNQNNTYTANFGASDFVHTAPTGFLAWDGSTPIAGATVPEQTAAPTASQGLSGGMVGGQYI